MIITNELLGGTVTLVYNRNVRGDGDFIEIRCKTGRVLRISPSTWQEQGTRTFPVFEVDYVDFIPNDEWDEG